MHILLAPDKFKGSMTADEVCAAMAEGLRAVIPDVMISSCPIADGGDGFVDVLQRHFDGVWIECPVHDAMGRSIMGRYVLCGDTAVMEMSEASGIRLVAEGERDVWQANTWGTGEMMRHAIEHSQVKRIIMGIGGSATNDAGCGMAAALGVRFLNGDGDTLNPTPDELRCCESVDDSAQVQLPEVLIACDVDNPLLGDEGATRVYGPQKGLLDRDVAELEAVLAKVVMLTGGQRAAELPGAGAAGGLGFGLVQFCNARLLSGFDLVAQETGLLEKIRLADVVVTGEGKLDAQTLNGKGPAGVAMMAREEGKQVVAIAGIVETAPLHLFDHAYALHDDQRSIAETMMHSKELIAACSSELARELNECSRPVE